MGYQIKSFKSWVNESKTNEGFMDVIKGISGRFMQFLKNFPGLAFLQGRFTGDGSWILNKTIEYQNGTLNSRFRAAVEIIPAPTTVQIISEAKKEVAFKDIPDAMPESLESKHYNNQMNEAFDEGGGDDFDIPLEHPNSIVKNINEEGLMRKIERQINVVRNMPESAKKQAICIWGAPGIGKTQIMKSLAKKHDMDIIIINLGELAPDILLIPSPGEGEGKQMSLDTPDMLPVYDITSRKADEQRKAKNGIGKDGKPRGGILFFDEMTRAHESNLQAAIPLIENRQITKWHVADKWIIIGAANRNIDDETSFEFSEALGNRFSQVNFVPSPEAWYEWAKDTTVEVYDEQGKLQTVPLFAPEMLDFLTKFKPGLLHKHNKARTQGTGLFPTRRRWEAAALEISNAIWTGEKLSLDDIEDIVATHVGVDIAKEYRGYLELVKGTDATKIIKHIWTDQENAPLPMRDVVQVKKGSETVEKDRGYKSDVMDAIISAILASRQGKELTFSEVQNVIDYFVRLQDATQVMNFMKRLLKEHPYLKTKSKTQIPGTPEYKQEHLDMRNYIDETLIDAYPDAYKSKYKEIS